MFICASSDHTWSFVHTYSCDKCAYDFCTVLYMANTLGLEVENTGQIISMLSIMLQKKKNIVQKLKVKKQVKFTIFFYSEKGLMKKMNN